MGKGRDEVPLRYVCTRVNILCDFGVRVCADGISFLPLFFLALTVPLRPPASPCTLEQARRTSNPKHVNIVLPECSSGCA